MGHRRRPPELGTRQAVMGPSPILSSLLQPTPVIAVVTPSEPRAHSGVGNGGVDVRGRPAADDEDPAIGDTDQHGRTARRALAHTRDDGPQLFRHLQQGDQVFALRFEVGDLPVVRPLVPFLRQPGSGAHRRSKPRGPTRRGRPQLLCAGGDGPRIGESPCSHQNDVDHRATSSVAARSQRCRCQHRHACRPRHRRRGRWPDDRRRARHRQDDRSRPICGGDRLRVT